MQRISALMQQARESGAVPSILLATTAAAVSLVLDEVAMSLLALVALVAGWTLVMWPREAKGLFSPHVFIPLVFGLYAAGMPIGVIVDTVGPEISRNSVVLVTWLHIGLLLTFMAATLSLLRMQPRTADDASLLGNRPDRNIGLIAWILIIGGAALYLTFIVRSFGSVGNFISVPERAERFLVSRGEGLFTSGVFLANFGWILLLASQLARPGRRLPLHLIAGHLVALAAYGAFWFRLGDRRVFASLALGLIFVVAALRPLRSLWVAAAGALAVVALQVFARIRHLVDEVSSIPEFIASSFSLEWIDPSNSELGIHFGIAVDIVERVPSELLGGRTYLDGTLNLVPSALWPGRPAPPGVVYAQELDPVRFESGGAFGFSFIGESYLNFGYLGPLVLGIALALLAWWLQRHLFSGDTIRLATYGGALSALMILARSDFASISKQLVTAALIPWAIVTVLSRMLDRRALAPDGRSIEPALSSGMG